ncbi:MAG TPA: hypothetical protein VKS82_14375 [Streptosporangiaceae bacterium]|nr:hypothetical protein [Streptosporangiaceae bacterium]
MPRRNRNAHAPAIDTAWLADQADALAAELTQPAQEVITDDRI